MEGDRAGLEPGTWVEIDFPEDHRHHEKIGRVVGGPDRDGDYIVEFVHHAWRDAPPGDERWHEWDYYPPWTIAAIEPTEEIEAQWLERILAYS